MILATTLTLVAKEIDLQRISPWFHSGLKLYSKPRGILIPAIRMSLMARLMMNMLVTFLRDFSPRMTKMTKRFPDSAKSMMIEYTTVKIVRIYSGTGGGTKCSGLGINKSVKLPMEYMSVKLPMGNNESIKVKLSLGSKSVFLSIFTANCSFPKTNAPPKKPEVSSQMLRVRSPKVVWQNYAIFIEKIIQQMYIIWSHLNYWWRRNRSVYI